MFVGSDIQIKCTPNILSPNSNISVSFVITLCLYYFFPPVLIFIFLNYFFSHSYKLKKKYLHNKANRKTKKNPTSNTTPKHNRNRTFFPLSIKIFFQFVSIFEMWKHWTAFLNFLFLEITNNWTNCYWTHIDIEHSKEKFYVNRSPPKKCIIIKK